MVLDEFKSRWKDSERAGSLLKNLSKDRGNSQLYQAAEQEIDNVANDTEVDDESREYYRNLRADYIGRQIPDVVLDSILKTRTSDLRSRAVNFGNTNLESILGDVDKDKLVNLALNTNTGNATGEIAEKVKAYQEMFGLSEIYNRSESSQQREAALAEMYNAVQRELSQRIQQAPYLSSLLLSARIDEAFTIRFFRRMVARKQKEAKELLDSKNESDLKNYISGIANSMNPENKEQFYSTLYAVTE